MPNSDPLKRATRYAKVVGAVARVGVGGFVHKKDKHEQAILLRAALGGLKGPVMKVGQILAVIPDLLPPEFAQELATLQADAPSMGWPFVRRRMVRELGADWAEKFQSFDRQASYAASLGQVHAAQTHDGQKIACKLQYPHMDDVIEADLRQLKLGFGLFERFSGALLTDDVFQEISERLREELDYKREAKNMMLYKNILATQDMVHVPHFIPELSTDRLLSMSWLEGERFSDVVNIRNQTDRNQIATNLFKAWYTPFYHYGVIHGDPHQGNYTFRPDNSINLLDFGCIRVFKPDIVQAVIMMFHAQRDQDQDKIIEAYRLWGFENPTKALIEALNIWAQFIYAPFVEDRVCKLDVTNAIAQGRGAAGQVYNELKKIGGVSIPRPFVMIDRASIGLGGAFIKLGAEINWHHMLHNIIEGFDIIDVKRKQQTMWA